MFTGQVIAVGSFSPDNDLEYFLGARYLPEIQYEVKLDSTKLFTVLGAANLSATSFFHPFDADQSDASIDPYRVWARYSTNRYEVRFGLQKIDFGSATMLRPMQWFSQIDPRDPLQLTNGVYAGLGRYYFPNNANIWLWALYGNDAPRGLDSWPSDPHRVEYGGRVQYPVPKGEVALSYHNRQVEIEDPATLQPVETTTENRIGIDGKWDLGVGLWFEGAYIHNSDVLMRAADQTFLTLGTDYTFGVGNGLSVLGEHMFSAFDSDPLSISEVYGISALSVTYPLTLLDNVSSMAYYDWTSTNLTYFLSVEHQFRRFTGYAMGYYNPTTQSGVQENELITNLAGPGIRLMLVYNH